MMMPPSSSPSALIAPPVTICSVIECSSARPVSFAKPMTKLASRAVIARQAAVPPKATKVLVLTPCERNRLEDMIASAPMTEIKTGSAPETMPGMMKRRMIAVLSTMPTSEKAPCQRAIAMTKTAKAIASVQSGKPRAWSLRK